MSRDCVSSDVARLVRCGWCVKLIHCAWQSTERRGAILKEFVIDRLRQITVGAVFVRLELRMYKSGS